MKAIRQRMFRDFLLVSIPFVFLGIVRINLWGSGLMLASLVDLVGKMIRISPTTFVLIVASIWLVVCAIRFYGPRWERGG